LLFIIREEVTGWSVSLRERLRRKFIHHLVEVGKFCETHGYWEQAIEFYRKGIDVDELLAEYKPIVRRYVSLSPLPATVWLFGSGLIGLVSVVRRRKH
jgi:two-component SAPR family response regulator